ncbi:MAG: hypothetical protein V2I82_13265 [Halieaceae bacterium]|jgi:hypothetical protein|nr:hypothetical protein [Halieaceae bacterium]
MDVTRVAGIPTMASAAAAAMRRPEGVAVPAEPAPPAPALPSRTRSTTPVQRVYDGEYLQAERDNLYRRSGEFLRSRLFDSDGSDIVYDDPASSSRNRGPAGLYRANAADRLLAVNEPGRFIDERV